MNGQAIIKRKAIIIGTIFLFIFGFRELMEMLTGMLLVVIGFNSLAMNFTGKKLSSLDKIAIVIAISAGLIFMHIGISSMLEQLKGSQ